MGARILPLLVPQPGTAALAQRMHLALWLPLPSGTPSVRPPRGMAGSPVLANNPMAGTPTLQIAPLAGTPTAL